MKLPNMIEAKKRTNHKTEFIYEDIKYNKSFKGKYLLKTYGCQMNVHDSEQISDILEHMGFTKTDTLEDCDIIILNTCAIRENAHDKVFGFLGRCKHLKKDKPNLIIGVCGCMAQEESVCNEILNKHPYIDIVFGTHNIKDLVNMVEDKDAKLNINVLSFEGNVYENNYYKRDSKYTAWVNIMYGCDKFCTYCIVPYTRGTQRSRKHEDIIKEVEELISEGYKEVTLLGQNVNAYGKDREDEISFASLLQKVADTKIERIRFVTSHPWDFTDEMIDVIANNDNVMPYIHLPIQSGSDRLLKLMGRRYTKEEYLTLFNKIKTRVKGCSITTDIIVGFPNESDEDFKETLDVVNACKYDGAFTFIYSKRENTPAALMRDDITLDIKEKRLQELNKVVNDYSLDANKKMIGTKQKVLILGDSEKNDMMYGYTENMKLVNVPKDINDYGSIIEVSITDAKSFNLYGEK